MVGTLILDQNLALGRQARSRHIYLSPIVAEHLAVLAKKPEFMGRSVEEQSRDVKSLKLVTEASGVVDSG
jgi:hypothetical protein